MKYLAGTGVDLAVEKDTKMIEKDFHSLVKTFFENHSEARSVFNGIKCSHFGYRTHHYYYIYHYLLLNNDSYI